MTSFSDYIIFVDESGSPNLDGGIDPGYPVFVLAFLIIKKSEYANCVIPAISSFKFKHFGHDQIILHERDIRKDMGAFKFLNTPKIKNDFLDELTDLIDNLPVVLVCVVINKVSHQAKYRAPANPYYLGLQFGMERVLVFLNLQGQKHSTHMVAECRGKTEDRELELEFRRICDEPDFSTKGPKIEIVFAEKKSNSIGLQLADLMARPIGVSVLKPDQSNRASAVLKSKLFAVNGKTEGWGLKCFP